MLEKKKEKGGKEEKTRKRGKVEYWYGLVFLLFTFVLFPLNLSGVSSFPPDVLFKYLFLPACFRVCVCLCECCSGCAPHTLPSNLPPFFS